MQTEMIYKIRNWSEYNRALIQRGSITLSVEEEALKKWYSSSHTCLAGRPATYSDEAILMLLMVREVFKLTLRSLEGFVKSLFNLMNLDLIVPSYTQISRRVFSARLYGSRSRKNKKLVDAAKVLIGE